MGCNASARKPIKVQKINTAKREKLHEEREKDKLRTKEENRDFHQTMNFLAGVRLFQCLPLDEHPMLAMACVHCSYATGEVVIRQGDDGSEFFIIKSGEASVIVEADGELTKVATLRSGDYFGESALLRDEPRSATIAAQGDLTALKITREKFKERGLNEKLQFVNRKAVVAGNKIALETKPPTPKNSEEEALIAGALHSNENLQTLVTLDLARVQAMINVAWKERVPKGTNIITEGDLKADYFYIVQEGIFEARVSEPTMEGTPRASALGTSFTNITRIMPGGSFGELALLYLVPRAATVQAMTDAVVWVIDRLNFKKIMMRVPDGKVKEYVSYLDRVEILAPLLSEERRAVAEALIEVHFSKGDVVLQEGEPGNTFYVLFDGEVSVSKGDKEQTRLSASHSRHEVCFFGERALLNNEPRAATVTVTSAVAKTLALDRDSFNLLLGPLEDIIKQTQAPQAGPRVSMVGMGGGPRMMAQISSLSSRERRIKRSELQRLGLLGCGGFGSVELVEHRETKETYAMKALSKGYILKTGMQESVMNEKNILQMTSSPFIIRLWETYNGAQTLYFLLEPALGGELYSTYNRKGFHGSEPHAKYYVAGVVEGFAHLHERRIIYRDLKPENLLINGEGQLKITDMGLAKFVIGMTYTTCGTPDYFAPELITSSGHTSAVDWWTLGILIFELMSGRPPFQSASPMQIYAKVMQGIKQVQFPLKCQGSVERLIKSLLKREPSERLSVRSGGLGNLRKHQWFASFDWEAFRALTMEPPYKPVVRSKTDMANFHARKEDMPRQIDYCDDGTGWDNDFATI